MLSTTSKTNSTEIDQFRTFLSALEFPCVGAKSALNRDRIQYLVCDELASLHSAKRIAEGLSNFSKTYPDPGSDPVSFVTLFNGTTASEQDFHDRLWRQLQLLHEIDAKRYDWAPDVTSDPSDKNFSFSVGGRAFFVVGLHPNSSRLSRRSPLPAMVFNFHEQFEILRSNGRYEKMQRAIRSRDIALQGSINPVLATFGDSSEALQYSGMKTSKCPFHHLTKASL